MKNDLFWFRSMCLSVIIESFAFFHVSKRRHCCMQAGSLCTMQPAGDAAAYLRNDLCRTPLLQTGSSGPDRCELIRMRILGA